MSWTRIMQISKQDIEAKIREVSNPKCKSCCNATNMPHDYCSDCFNALGLRTFYEREFEVTAQ